MKFNCGTAFLLLLSWTLISGCTATPHRPGSDQPATLPPALIDSQGAPPIFSGILNAETAASVTYRVRELFNDDQTADRARERAIKRAKRELLQQFELEIAAHQLIKQNNLTSEQITALSAEILQVAIVSENRFVFGNHFGLGLTLSVQVDLARLERQLALLQAEGNWPNKLKQSQLREQQLLARIAELEQAFQKMEQGLASDQDLNTLWSQYQRLKDDLKNNWSWLADAPAHYRTADKPEPF
ncbi:MAG: hypothetical protein HQL67_01855 [Magnetococcales bacterium]|nr:hypothetical protein [Magnetococcales bacterium]